MELKNKIKLIFKKPNPEFAVSRNKWIRDPEVSNCIFETQKQILQEDKNWFQEYSNDKTQKFWAICRGEKYIGMVGFIHLDLKEHQSDVFVMIGEKKYWGRGIGKRALKFLLKKAKKLKLKNLFLEVFEENKRAFNLYKGQGFFIISQKGNEISMQKEL